MVKHFRGKIYWLEFHRVLLGLLLFLIYINDLLNGIKSICKIFADDTSLFSKVNDTTFSDTQLNNDLNKISKWAFQ